MTYNSSTNKVDSLNFISDVLPILEQNGKRVYVFTGDICAFDWGPSLFYENSKNVTYIVSEMGGGLIDDYLVVNVHEDKSTNI